GGGSVLRFVDASRAAGWSFRCVPRGPRRSALCPYTTLFRSPVSTRSRRVLKLITGCTHGTTLLLPCPPQLRRRREQIGIGEHQRSEEHTSELQSRFELVCRLLLEKKKHGQT